MIRALGLATILLLAAHSAHAASPALKVELNKLEPREGACRAYLVFENRSDATFTSFKLDLVMFDKSGVIASRLAVEGAPLPAQKTLVKLFDIQGLACADIGRVLLNDLLACQDGSGARNDCLAGLELGTRAAVPFSK